MKESNVLIAIDVLRKIMNIFYGPFLTVYFIKISTESIIPISLYNIMSYFLLGVMALVLGWVIKQKWQLEVFRLGIIINFIYIFTILILKENIVNHLCLIAFLFGISMSLYYYPHNLLSGVKVSNKNRAKYEFHKKVFISIGEIVTPLILGCFITTTDFYFTTFIILLFSFIQIILSFFVNPFETKKHNFNILKSFKELSKNKNVVNIFFIDYIRGLNISDSALQVILTILIFNSFKTDLNLGILTSLSTVLVVMMEYFYVNYVKDKNNKFLLYTFAVIPVITLLLLMKYTNDFTLILYYFCYSSFVNILLLLSTIKIFNVSNCNDVKENNLLEYWSIREFFVGLGRTTGYVLLFIIGIIDNINYLYYLMLILTLSILLLAYFLSETENYEEVS